VSGTAINAALVALAAAFDVGKPSTDWTVRDGRPFDPKRRFLAVGWDQTDRPSVAASRTPGDMGFKQTGETFEVSNLLSLWSGKELTTEARAEAFAAFDAFDAALAADRKLGGTVQLAQISGYEFTPSRAAEGVVARIRFIVTIRASI
jgi:hypothetical protein